MAVIFFWRFGDLKNKSHFLKKKPPLEFNLFVLKKREEDRDKSKINKDKKTNMNKRKKTDFKSALDNFWFNFLPNELSLERFQHVY